ncbi:MAG: hypothetical protein ABI843_06675 [Dokdonella sp.]
MSRLIAFSICLCALVACSSHPAEDAAAQQAAAAPAKQKTVFDDQLKALEKAKAVQKTVDDAAKAQQKAIDDNGG